MKVELFTKLKRYATKILADLHDTKEPLLITEHSQPSAYLLDVEDYQRLQRRMAILEGITPKEKAIQEGDIYSQAQAKEEMSK